jgi:hypothetical protein
MKELALDIETAPSKAYIWQKKVEFLPDEMVIQEGYVLCWAASWMHEKQILSDSIFNYPTPFKQDPTNDFYIAKTIWKLVDDADVIIGQNIKAFDLKHLHQLWFKHGLGLPSPSVVVDTLTESRRRFKTLSHKLDYRGRQLGIGKKVEHEGFGLWVRCMQGNVKAWGRMIHYCKQDVQLLKDYYLKLKPYIKTPSRNVIDGIEGCKDCGGDLIKKGFLYTVAGKKQKYLCKSCRKWQTCGRQIKQDITKMRDV